MRNSFSPIFYGRLKPRTTGTHISGRFQLHPVVRVFLTFWFGGAAAIALTPFFTQGAHQNQNVSDVVIWVIGVTVVVLLGVGVVLAGKWFARFQLQDLHLFLERELEAQHLHEKTSEPPAAGNAE